MVTKQLQPRLTITRSNVISLALTAVVLIIFIAAVAHLVGALGTQFETGQVALNAQLVEQAQSFTQLQRETLRLLSHVNTPVDRLDREAAQLQIDLLASRFFQLAAVAEQPATRPEQAEAARSYSAQRDGIIDAAQQWLQSPEDDAVQTSVIEQLTALERSVNQDVINFGRERVQTVIAFRDATNQVQAAFVISAFTFVLLMLALLYNIYLMLRQVQKTEAALETIRFKDQFLAVMSHELRTPLNAIIGFLGIMKMQGANSAKFPHMVDRARVNADRLLNLIDDILDMSKIEAGKFEIHPEPVTIRDLVNRWKAQADILALQKDLEFDCVVDDAIPQRVLMDADAVSKITTNLLSNALKFTEKGSVKLHIESLGDQWRIRVSDTGIGIASDKTDLIFESFRQMDGSIRRNYGGSGLGLSIVKQLTELMGGRVELDSEEGSGSTFTITLPLVVVHAPEPQLEQIPA